MTVFALRVKATESCSKYGSEKSICFCRSAVTNMSAMIVSILPLASAAMSPENSWSAKRTFFPIAAPNRFASSMSKPASSLFCTALNGSPPLETPTTIVSFAVDAGSVGICWLRFVIQRSTMSFQTPLP